MKRAISSLLLASMLLTLSPLTLPISAEKSELDVKWNDGWAVISPLNPYGYNEGYTASGSYSATDVFTVPKAGTKLTWTDTSGFASNSVLTVSNWKQENGKWVLDREAPMFVGAKGEANNIIETKNASGVTYIYVTHSDNESIRLCSYGTGENIKVYAEETNYASSWSRALKLYDGEAPIPTSPITGAELDVSVVEDIKWNYGYVGSTSHSSKANKISNGSSLYLYSSVITVPKAGTTVYFYDDSAVDRSDGSYASSNAAIFSHWKKQGSGWVIDTSRVSISGSEAERYPVGDFMLYRYTTTEDNENLRLCYRGALSDYSLPIKPSKVFLAAPADITPITQTGTLTNAHFTDAAGNKIDYKVYLPASFKDDKYCKVIFNVGASTEIIDALINNKTEAAIFSIGGSTREAQKLIDAVITGYSLNAYYMYLLGSPELNEACGEKFVNYIKDASAHSSPLEAGKALLEAEPEYYSVLEGVKLYAMGDSYFGGSSLGKSLTWVNKLGDKYEMDYINYGIGGSTMSNYVTNRNPMVTRIKDMEREDANIILLEGGRNDLNNEVPLGAIDSRDTKTFHGAVNYMLDHLLETYPNALIILITPWKYTTKRDNGYSNVTYADAMRSVAEERNDPRIVCLYAADPALTGVDMDDASFRAKYSIKPSDPSHLNEEGMKLVLPYMEKFIAEAYAAYLKPLGEEETTAEETTAEATQPSPEDTTENSTATHTAQEETSETAPEKGCGSFSALGPLTAIICGACAVLFKKKKYC